MITVSSAPQTWCWLTARKHGVAVNLTWTWSSDRSPVAEFDQSSLGHPFSSEPWRLDLPYSSLDITSTTLRHFTTLLLEKANSKKGQKSRGRLCSVQHLLCFPVNTPPHTHSPLLCCHCCIFCVQIKPRSSRLYAVQCSSITSMTCQIFPLEVTTLFLKLFKSHNWKQTACVPLSHSSLKYV